MKRRLFFLLSNILLFVIACLMMIKHAPMIILLGACAMIVIGQITFRARFAQWTAKTRVLLKPLFLMAAGGLLGTVIGIFVDDYDPSYDTFWDQSFGRYGRVLLTIVPSYVSMILLAMRWKYLVIDILLWFMLKDYFVKKAEDVKRKMLEVGYLKHFFIASSGF